jgi:hypothetical protein
MMFPMGAPLRWHGVPPCEIHCMIALRRPVPSSDRAQVSTPLAKIPSTVTWGTLHTIKWLLRTNLEALVGEALEMGITTYQSGRH